MKYLFLLLLLFLTSCFSFGQKVIVEDIDIDYRKNILTIEISKGDCVDNLSLTNTTTGKQFEKICETRNGEVVRFKIDGIIEVGIPNELELSVICDGQKINNRWNETRPNRMWILSLGTGDNPCDSKYNTLEHSFKGAEDVYNRFIDIGRKAYDIKGEMLINRETATSSIIIKAINNIISNVKKDDLVIVYLSGHGQGTEEQGPLFRFQVKKEEETCDGDWVDKAMWDSIRQIAMKGASVWLFVNACHAERLQDYYRSLRDEQGINGKADWAGGGIAVVPGDEQKSKGGYNTSEAYEDKDISKFPVSLCNALENKEKKQSEKLSKILYSLREHYYTTNENSSLYNYKTFGDIIDQEEILYYKRPSIMNQYLDFSIGYHLSRQGNVQIGSTWKRWSAFVEISGSWNGTDSITHILGRNKLQDKLPSIYIGSIGLGGRWYPFIDKRIQADVGFTLTASMGLVYGEKAISGVETIRHTQWFYSISPAISGRWWISKQHHWRMFADIGYRLYFPWSINSDLKWWNNMSTNVGVSIPLSKP